jgi:tRNA pseudouridine55 synthase
MDEPFGLLNLLKPPGMSSHDVVAVVRRILKTKRVGHGGTLDPLAAGVMTVAVGKATRLLDYLNHEKSYWAEIAFGLSTDTLDAEGRPTARACASQLTAEKLESVLVGFRGTQSQTPPMTSAVHVNGKRLYELARAGVTLSPEERPSRTVTISQLRLLAFAPGSLATARVFVRCSAGTYIRSLAFDVGAALGLPACLAFLLRTAAGDCSIETAQTLEELALCPRFLPIEQWLGHLPVRSVSQSESADVRLGRCIPLTKPLTETEIRLHAPDGTLVALARAKQGSLHPFLVF